MQFNIIQGTSICGLYYNYKDTSDDDIRKKLEKVKFLCLHNGKLYSFTDRQMQRLVEKPRGVALSFEGVKDDEDVNDPSKMHEVTGLVEWKRITFLVKSSSRFFLKPDVGEVIDQVYFHDWYDSKFAALAIDQDDYKLLPDTEGEHFLMTAILYTHG
jgi:hypothetical protein